MHMKLYEYVSPHLRFCTLEVLLFDEVRPQDAFLVFNVWESSSTKSHESLLVLSLFPRLNQSNKKTTTKICILVLLGA